VGRPARDDREARPFEDPRVRRAGWGNVTRRGAAGLNSPGEDAGSTRPRRDDRDRPGKPDKYDLDARPPRQNARYVVKGPGAEALLSAGERPARPARPVRRRKVPVAVATELGAMAPAREVARLEARLADATRAYGRDRYPEALTILRELIRSTPGVAAVRELYGLTLYRLGRWKDAIRELTAFAELSGSVDQHPVLADCERALGHHERVAELWGELRQAGAGSDVLAEGRLVMAGSLADRGRLAEAIALLEPAANRPVRKPLDRHIRQWYALADLYERSNDVPRAREFFRRVVDNDPETSDALERLAGLR
jgi:tetratricopeptide (TPR) repeat protein